MAQQMDSDTKDALQRLANHLAGRQGKDAKVLAGRLRAAVVKGQVKAGDFTMADLNIIQSMINTQEFTAQVMDEIAAEHGPVASNEAAKARALAAELKKYQAAIAKLGVTP